MNFKSPKSTEINYVGGLKAHITYTPVQIPRNAILIRPDRPEQSEAIYKLLVALWKAKVFQYFAIGSCQKFIRSREIKALLHGKGNYLDRFSWPNVKVAAQMLKDKPVPCGVFTVDTSLHSLQAGDILLCRIGSKNSIARPYLIF